MILEPTIDGEVFAKGIHRCTKWINQSAGLILRVILATVAFVFLFWTASIAELESNQPFFTIMRARAQLTLVSSANVEHDERTINDPSITGIEAVKRFRAHLQCFSESGKWVYDPTPRHVPWNYVGQEYESTCDGRHQSEGGISDELAEDIALRGAPGNWSVRESLKWVWQTNSSCPWRSINRDNFCRKMGPNNHILVVGDSLKIQEIYWSLMNALVEVGRNGSEYEQLPTTNPTDWAIEIAPYEMCGDIFGEGHGLKVSYVRNDRLSPILNATVDDEDDFLEFPWLDILEPYGVKTLLLNRGAHYEDDEKFTTGLREIFTTLSLRFPQIHVIFRNTMPGHLDCMSFTSPLAEPQDQDLPYHWRDFDRQNHLAKKLADEFHFTYIDVFPMLVLRADGHLKSDDCLHYCIPGPLDSVVEYLYNILLLN